MFVMCAPVSFRLIKGVIVMPFNLLFAHLNYVKELGMAQVLQGYYDILCGGHIPIEIEHVDYETIGLRHGATIQRINLVSSAKPLQPLAVSLWSA